MGNISGGVENWAAIAWKNRNDFVYGYEQASNASDGVDIITNIGSNKQGWLCEKLGSTLLGYIVSEAAGGGIAGIFISLGAGWLDDKAKFTETVCNALTQFEQAFPGKYNDFFPGPDLSLPRSQRIDSSTAKSFGAMSNYPQRSDPFTLDLDGDGIETEGVSTINPVMFDLKGTGVKQSVGWIKSDDGLLALDRNGNGLIDSGAELFGDATTLTTGPNAGQKATDGFSALADLDSNGDGLISSLDAQFSALRVWRDLNQDGVSQAGELYTLAQLGIASINVSKTEHSTALSNGNVVADLGSYTRSDGTQGEAGTAGQLADVDLAVDSFTSQFTDTLPISDAAQALPDMQGAGQVRSLRETATLSTTLAGLVAQFSSATTRAGQYGLVDQIIKAWSDTSTMSTVDAR